MKLSQAVEQYVEHKRSGGIRFHLANLELHSFCRRIGDGEVGAIATAQIQDYLNEPQNSAGTWRRKYRLLAQLFRYSQMLGNISAIQMPPPRGIVRRTFTPYIYSRGEVRELLRATKDIRWRGESKVPGETLRMLLLLMYGTGCRTSEATKLITQDVDLDNRVIRLHMYGTGCVRSLPIGSDLHRIIKAYSRWKRRAKIEGEFFLLRWDGSQISKDALYDQFRRLLKHTSIVRRDHVLQKPRICDLRATFAVHQITSWIRHEKDLNRLLPALSAYLGQADLNAAERFLILTPDRFKKELDKLSPMKGKKWSANIETMAFVSEL